jgi:hypothetical protein
MAGRPPKPRALKLLQGTLRKDRDYGPEPPSPIGAECPPWLHGKARELWKRWAPVYTAIGCLRECHTITFARWMETEADIITLREAGEPVSVSLKDVAMRYAVQFAGTASASSRVHAEPAKPKTKLEKFRAEG